MQLRSSLVTLILSLLCVAAFADGIQLTRDGHFTTGHRLSLRLTSSQRHQLEQQRKERGSLHDAKLSLLSYQTDYIYQLTSKTVTELNVFEGGYGDCSCCAHNVASRFSPSRVEITTSYLMDTQALIAMRQRMQLLAAESRARYEQRRKHWWQLWRPRM